MHPSLKLSEKDKKHRSVLKRTERLKMMMEKGQWKEGDIVFSLPKIKTLRIKIKKEKVEKAEVVAPEGVTSTTTEVKEQTTAKATADRSQDKKQ